MKNLIIISIFSLFIFSCKDKTNTFKSNDKRIESNNSSIKSFNNLNVPDSLEICDIVYHDVTGSVVSCGKNCIHEYDLY